MMYFLPSDSLCLDSASFSSDAGTEIAQCKTLVNTNLTPSPYHYNHVANIVISRR